MPVYEYACRDCNEKFDMLVRTLDAADEVTCGACSGHNVRRLVSSFATVGGFDDPVVRQESTSSVGCCGGSCGCRH